MDGNGQTVQEEIVAKDSYNIKLMADSSDPNGSVGMEEDFKLQDEDVIMETVNGIPSITFSDHVHKFIEKKMALSIVIKLLGRKIAFNTLLNKEKDDFDRVVWVVFDHYLSVRTWSASFRQPTVRWILRRKSRNPSEGRTVGGNNHFGGSKFSVLEAEGEETRINNHRVSESIGTGVMEENLMIFSLKNETVIEVRKGTSFLEMKVMEAVNGDAGVKG
ncbi:hypothetical protein Gotri_012869 [Gossypium trilobum]|uniref:Uncharacterized protein n=1 Tax=Gossypium trilobum TaxID=34281 RepID=A0A7J9DRT3_9ROSI|nr:hypothetical protein [Gossypium trilobum]